MRRHLAIAYLALLIGATAFGAGDQYLGSLEGSHGIVWAAQVSLLSAPWLLLPFLAGSLLWSPRSAALVGMAVSLSALAGYAIMTNSPIEHAHLTFAGIEAFVIGNVQNIVGGLVTGPVFGWFGNRWWTTRAWWAGVPITAAFCLEPLAHILLRYSIPSLSVSLCEVFGGLTIAAYFLAMIYSNQRPRDRLTGP